MLPPTAGRRRNAAAARNRFAIFVGGGEALPASPPTQMERDLFSGWVQFWHHDWRELRTKELELPADELATVGVLLRHVQIAAGRSTRP